MLMVCLFAWARLPAQEVCTTCIPDVFESHAPPANIVVSFIESVSVPGECHGPLVNCNPALDCEFNWWMGIVVTNPSPPDPMPRVKLTIGSVTVELDWGILTGTEGVATLESVGGKLSCGSSSDGFLSWIGSYIGVVQNSCSGCLRSTG